MSRNPILNDRAFGQEAPGVGRAPSPAEEWANASRTVTMGADATFAEASTHGPIVTSRGRVMSLGGVASASLLMFAVLLLGAWWGWTQVVEHRVAFPAPGQPDTVTEFRNTGLFFGALILGFVLAIATAFMPKIARFTALPYSLVQGAVLGMISHLYNVETEGIVAQAIICTFGVFVAMLVLYGLRILRATPRFVKGVIGATFGIVVLYLGSFVWRLITGNTPSFLWDSSPLSIGISVIIVGIAALNLILDFDFIEQGSRRQLPGYMDWYAAFGLMLTLIWLYLEMLRLLSKIRN